MKRTNEVLVGLLTIVAVAVLIGGTYWLSRGSFRSGYPLYTVVEWGQGLKTGQNVLLAGIAVGYVDDVELRQEGTLVIKMRIEKRYQIPLGSVAAVQSASIFGDMLIALRPDSLTGQYYAQGDTLPSAKGGATATDVIASADSVSRALESLLAGIQRELVDAGTIAELRNTLAGTGRLVAQLGEIAATQSSELSATMGDLRRAVASVDSAKIGATLENFQSASANMNALTMSLQKTGDQLNGVMARLESGEGTAGKLLSDPGLYDDMRATMGELRTLLTDFKADPKRYLGFTFSIFGGRR